MKNKFRRFKRRTPIRSFVLAGGLLLLAGVLIFFSLHTLNLRAYESQKVSPSSSTLPQKPISPSSSVSPSKANPVQTSTEKSIMESSVSQGNSKSSTQIFSLSSQPIPQTKTKVSESSSSEATQTFEQTVTDVNGKKDVVTLTAPKTTVLQPTEEVKLPITGPLTDETTRFYLLDKNSSWEQVALKSVNKTHLEAYGYIQDSTSLKSILGEKTWLALGHYLSGNSPLLVVVENNQLTLKGINQK